MNKKLSFKEILSFLYVNPDKFKYHKDAHHLSLEERKLLKAYAAYKKGNCEEVFELIRGKRFQTQFSEGVRCYLLALTYNHFGYLKFAKEFFNKAQDLFQQSGDKHFLFYVLCEKFLLYSNLKQFAQMEDSVKGLKNFKASHGYDQLLKNYALALHYFNMRKEKLALELIDRSLSMDLKEVRLFKNAFLMTLFRIQLRANQYQECYKTLEKYKKANGFTVDVNYKYIKLLLDFIVQESPLYVYARDFKHNPEIYQQLQCIDYLARNQLEEAKKIWSQLQNHNSKIYQDEFSFPNDDSLFSKALTKVLSLAATPKGFNLRELELQTKTMDKLEYILKFNNTSITKALLIEYLWQEKVDEKSLKKLSRLMMRYKKLKGLSIKSYQETYKISA